MHDSDLNIVLGTAVLTRNGCGELVIIIQLARDGQRES